MRSSTFIRSVAYASFLAFFCTSAQAATNQFNVTSVNNFNYIINGVNDPTDLVLVRGFTYAFNVNVASIHPFNIKTAPVTGSGSRYNDGVSAQGVTSGTVIFDVPLNAPDTLFYQCSTHASMTGPLTIVDAPVVTITDFNVTSSVVIESTGTAALNLNVLTRSNLTQEWSNATILSNVHVGGTNTTQVLTPAGNAAFFQVQQGFF